MLTLLSISLSAGFFTLVSYLPQQFGAHQTTLAANVPSSRSLSEILDTIPISEEKNLSTKILPEELKPIPPLPKITMAKPPKSETIFRPITLNEEGFLKEADRIPLRPFAPLPELSPKQYSSHFPFLPPLKEVVEFWRNIYANYSTTQTVLHDNLQMNIVYGVLDFSEIENNATLNEETKQNLREKITGMKVSLLQEMLLRFDQGSLPETKGEQVVYELFQDLPNAGKFRQASERIRTQKGLKNRFEEGLVRSGRYMPFIESLFEEEGVPKEISKLVFVESLFTLGALSKVGAGGPWQFMPETARKFHLKINEYVDERVDPLLSAKAASQLLRKNYELFESWPLAINAYNTGTARIIKAAHHLQTKNIATIIHHFKDPGYQFASRNFYPEFLAAFDVATHYQEYFGPLELETPMEFDRVSIPHHTSLYALAQKTATDIETLKNLNPALREKVFSPLAFLPKQQTLRIPKERTDLFLAALDEIFQEERKVPFHIVKKGETLFLIAERYGVAPEVIQSANGLLGFRLKQGQVLKIPSIQSQAVLETQ